MSRKKSKRTRKVPRTLQKRKLIVCEGKTEQRYFQYMKEDKDFKKIMGAVNVKVIQANHSSPTQIVTYAMELAAEKLAENFPYHTIWIVFDHDNYSDRKDAYDKAKNEKFEVAFSSICFEEWYLLHFIKSTKPFQNCSDLIAQLKKHYKTYEKVKQNDYQLLKDKIDFAKKNAVWLRKQINDTQSEKHLADRNPWTDVDLLILDLIENI